MTTAMVIGSLLSRAGAHAQTPTDLAAGRQLFVEALADEEHGRFAEALAKYKRVLSIKDTANIRYRIGSSLEHLGKLVQAVDAYAATVKVGMASGTSADAEVARAAQARVDALAPKLAHVTIRLPSSSPPGAEVAIDGEPAAPQALVDVPLDPGSHVVTATAPGVRAFRAAIDLTEGARMDVPVVLEMGPVAAPPSPSPPPPPPAGSPYRTIGIVTASAGGVLLVGGVVVLALRSSAIGKLHDACPDDRCPASQRDDLESTRDRAKLEGPLGVTLVATCVAAAAAGVVLVMLGGSEKKTALRLAPVPASRGATLTLGRSF
ncbi:hypothetical protein BH11MYX4_BH11MYX4_33330 [soil metagenome]